MSRWDDAGRRAFKRWFSKWRKGGFSLLDKSVWAENRAVEWWKARREDFDERAFRMGWAETEDTIAEG